MLQRNVCSMGWAGLLPKYAQNCSLGKRLENVLIVRSLCRHSLDTAVPEVTWEKGLANKTISVCTIDVFGAFVTAAL